MANLIDKNQATKTIRFIVVFTITWNVLEAVISIWAGRNASSAALIGFGLDSVIEVISAAAVAWQFSAKDPEVVEAREHRALRIIAWSFFALAAYITVESISALLGYREPEHSTVGLVITALSLVVMPIVSWIERHNARAMGSRSAEADSKQTLICTYLSAAVFIGLACNSLFGWGWADSVAGLIIAAVAVYEGRNALKGKTCCCNGC
ncbi:MAG: cation transporter [Corynebacterium sp.]|nr:cation transporter [Corynebacterium sp.]